MAEYAIIVTITICVMVVIGVLAREFEIASQRKERHDLKDENAAMKLYMRAKGLEWPPPPTDIHTGGKR